MSILSDILLGAGAIGAAFYCVVLSRRLKRFNNLEQGVGGAVAVLSSRVDELTKTLSSAQKTAALSAESLLDLTTRAEESSRRIELQIASLHDLPAHSEAETQKAKADDFVERRPAQPMFVRHQKLKEAG